MSAMEIPATATPPRQGRIGRRMPSSRGGLAWLAVLIIIGALLALQFGRQVYANWEMGQRADELAAQISAYEAENAQLQAELDYLESNAFVGAEARRLANVGARGEEALIIPRGAEAPLPPELVPTVEEVPLLEQWLRLFFGSPAS
jgi:cell division protein FtsB